MNKIRNYLPALVLIMTALGLMAFFAERLLFWEVPLDQEFAQGHYLTAILPLLVILGLAAVGILVCIWIRRKLMERDPGFRDFARERGGSCVGARPPRGNYSLFMMVRWVVMILSAVLLIGGVQILGSYSHPYALPVLACPLQQDQLVASGCYYFAHLDVLLTLPWKEILAFVLSFVISIVLLGRVICGFLCPLGLTQDLTHQVRKALRVEGVSMTERMYGVFRPIRWLMVLLMLGLCFVGGNFCNFCPAITQTVAFAGFTSSVYASGFLMVLLLIASFFKRRVWCNICPLGYLIGLFHRFSLFQLKKDTQACTECGACYEACPMGIRSIYTERDKVVITETDCILCGECIRCCPEDRALAMTFAGKPIYQASRKKLMHAYQGRKQV